MIARNAEHLMPGMLQPLEETACLLELLGLRALGEIAADDDEVGLQLIDAVLDGLDQALVMRAKMQVREMDEASHGASTTSC